MLKENEWTAKDSQDNTLATASKAGVAGKRHILTGVTASFGAAAIKLLQIKDGTTVILERYVHNAADLTFPNGIPITVGALVSAELAASGTGGVLGKVAITGLTEG